MNITTTQVRGTWYFSTFFFLWNCDNMGLNGTIKKFKCQNRDVLKFRDQNETWVIVRGPNVILTFLILKNCKQNKIFMFVLIYLNKKTKSESKHVWSTTDDEYRFFLREAKCLILSLFFLSWAMLRADILLNTTC